MRVLIITELLNIAVNYFDFTNILLVGDRCSQ